MVRFFALTMLAVTPSLAGAADLPENPFHIGTGTNKPAWTEKTQKRINSCAADYQAVLSGKKPVHARLDPSEESTESEQYYEGGGYQLHVTKSPAVIDGVSGFVFGLIIEFDEGFAEGDALSILQTAFYTAEELKKTNSLESPFHVGTGKDAPAWTDKAQKRIQASTGDFQAVIAGKKPIYAMPAGVLETHFYKGDGYQIDIVKESVVIGGVRGFFYGPMLDLDPDPLHPSDIESISHVTFYTTAEMKKLLAPK